LGGSRIELAWRGILPFLGPITKSGLSRTLDDPGSPPGAIILDFQGLTAVPAWWSTVLIETARKSKSEPISIVKPEPPVAAGQGSGCPAHPTKPLGTPGSARSDVESGMGRGGVSPLGSGARTIPVKAVVVGRATAESPGAGCGASRDRMTSVQSRRSSVSRCRRWIRAWGRDEPATDEPAA